jgi:phosphatidylinositol alpha-1,6-mannosyltransferase
VVYTSTHPGAAQFDARQPFEVIREDTSMLLPTPAVARRAAEIAQQYGCTQVWFGAAAPLGLLASGLRERTGITRAVALTHGHEAGWAALPGARGLLRRIGRGVDVVTYLGEYFRVRLARAIGDLTTLEQLAPGVDTDAFSPSVSGEQVRTRYGLTDRPVIVSVSRLVPRKGQDTLIRALPLIRRKVPNAALLIVSGGPYRSTLEGLAAENGVAAHVVFTGTVAWSELPSHHAAGDVFAMPCRTRRGGLDVEGLGIVYLEASAVGRPVVAGDSGGAPDAVRDGETGYVVAGRDVPALAERIIELLSDQALAARMGAAGRVWVDREWRWDTKADRLATLLAAPSQAV